MAKKSASEQHQRVAERLAEEFKAMILGSLPRIDSALKRDIGQASFSVTAQFKQTRDEGSYVCELKPRERIPLEPAEIKVGWNDGQLDLFSGAQADSKEPPTDPFGGDWDGEDRPPAA